MLSPYFRFHFPESAFTLSLHRKAFITNVFRWKQGFTADITGRASCILFSPACRVTFHRNILIINCLRWKMDTRTTQMERINADFIISFGWVLGLKFHLKQIGMNGLWWKIYGKPTWLWQKKIRTERISSKKMKADASLGIIFSQLGKNNCLVRKKFFPNWEKTDGLYSW